MKYTVEDIVFKGFLYDPTDYGEMIQTLALRIKALEFRIEELERKGFPIYEEFIDI